MTTPETGLPGPVLQEAARGLDAAVTALRAALEQASEATGR